MAAGKVTGDPNLVMKGEAKKVCLFVSFDQWSGRLTEFSWNEQAGVNVNTDQSGGGAGFGTGHAHGSGGY